MKYREILEQVITEINMSPGVLQRLAASIDAKAGMEFEMIIPGAAQADDDYDMEPDYSQDERIRRFSDIRNFFHDGDYNSRRDIDNLEQSIMDDYLGSEWLGEREREEWESVAEEHVRDLVSRDYEDEFRQQAEEEAKEQAPEFGVSGDELDAAVEERFKQLVEEKVKDIMDNMGDEYDEALDEWRDEQWSQIWNDDDMITDWLESEGIRNMSDITSNYEISWPYYESSSSGGDVDIEQVADEFGDAIGRPVNHSQNYHGAKRTTDGYSVEPDGSLDPDDSNDGGLEFISPPLPINDMFSDLDKVYKWAKRTGAYTNDSTGLHINVSVPGWDGDLNKLDYVKLALLLGDEYILNEFGRSSNTYCKSALKIVKDHIRQRPEDAGQLLKQMKDHLSTAASKLIHSGSTSKYTSINVKDGYIEFRSPGGDWLDEDIEKIKSTLLRFVVAMDAAVNESKYKEEYAKKLYKLLAPSNDESDTLQYFARFSAGELPRSALASFVKQAQLQRKLKKGPTGAKYWWSVGRPGYFASVEVVASSKEEAIEKGLAEYPDWRGARDITAKPLRPHSDAPVRATVGEPQPVGRVRADGPPQPAWQQPGGDTSQTDAENRLGWPDQTGDANYEVIDRSNGQRKFVFIANTDQDALRKYEDWLSAHGLPQDTENYGFREIVRPGSTLDLQRQRATTGETTGRWKVMIDGEEVYRFSVGREHNNQTDANRIAQDWISQQIRQGTLRPAAGAQMSVTPVMQ